MDDDFSAFTDSLNRVSRDTFRRMQTHRPHLALGAAKELCFAATSPVPGIADSIRDHIEIGSLLTGLTSPDWRVSVAAHTAVTAIARRFGPDYGLSAPEIEANPLQVCQNLADDRLRDWEDLQAILYKTDPIYPSHAPGMSQRL